MRKASSVAVRLIWSMSPCRAPALKPCFSSDLSTMPTSLLRLQKMMAFLTFVLRISSRSASRLAQSWLVGAERKRCVMVVGRRRGRATSMRTGSLQELVGEALDFGRHGRGEEQRLAARRQQLADALDVGDEAHVEHAVGLVDDEDLDAGQQQLAALEMIEQPAGRGDQHVDAAVELLTWSSKETPPISSATSACGSCRISRSSAPPGRPARASARGSASAACAPGRGRSPAASIIGSTKAAVLPVPVCAMPSTSRPV